MPAENDGSASCDEIIQYLYVGDKSTARNMDYLKATGITHIVNATSELRNYFEKEPGFTYLNAPCLDSDVSDISIHFDKAVVFIDDARKLGHSVLVHCQQGVCRSSTLVLVYLMKSQKMALADAYKCIRTQRPKCKVRPNFLRQVIQWDNKTKNKNKNKNKTKNKTNVASDTNQSSGAGDDGTNTEININENRDAKSESVGGGGKKRKSGPTMPPHLMKKQNQHQDQNQAQNQKEENTGDDKDKPLVPKKRVVSVTMPPQSQSQAVSATTGEKTDTSASAGVEGGEEEKKKRRVGVTMPPGWGK